MSANLESTTVRKPRADAQRNRVLLLETARAVFADKGADASLDAIARAAGVGIGTLYRHFPTRDALVEEVYRNATQQLADAATTLAEAYPPVEALRRWMRLFVDHIATKRVMAEALSAIVGGSSELYAASSAQLRAAMALLVDRAVASGDIQLSVDPLDLLRALMGVANVSSGPDWQESARRLVDILIAGVRVPGREG